MLWNWLFDEKRSWIELYLQSLEVLDLHSSKEKVKGRNYMFELLPDNSEDGSKE